MELLILILIEVEANDLAHTSFHPSSPSAPLPHFSEPNKVYSNDLASTSFSPSPLPIIYPHSSELDEVKGTIRKCIPDLIKSCEERNIHPAIYLNVVLLKVIGHVSKCMA